MSNPKKGLWLYDSQGRGYDENQIAAIQQELERRASAPQGGGVEEAMERAAEEIEQSGHPYITTVGASRIIRKHMAAFTAQPRTDAAQQRAWSVPEVVERMRTDAATYARAGHQVTANALLAFADALAAAPSAPVGVEGVEAALQKWLDWCNEHNEEPEARSGARIAIEALAQQPAACVGCEGKPAPENSPCAVCGQQPAAVDEAMRKVAAIAHSGGLLNMSEADALTAIRRLSLPYWGKEEKPEQVRSTLAGQQQENGNG